MNKPTIHNQLVLDAQNGDFEAFRKIVLHYSNALLSVAYNVIGDFHEAQDVVQEAFVKCYRNLHTLKEPSQLGSWLYSIAHRTSLDFVKKKKATLPYDDSTDQQLDNVHSWFEQHMLGQSVWHALQSLEDKSKSAVVLHYISDWSMKEIGQFLNLSTAAVESRIRRARETLKQLLTEDFESYFRPYRLGRNFEQTVCEQVLRRAGHFYIPVTNKKQTTDWFRLHFQLQHTIHGNLQLESGHSLYLLESDNHLPTDNPVLTFSVSDANELSTKLKNNGVRIEPIEDHQLFGKLLVFYDPDGNKFNAVEQK